MLRWIALALLFATPPSMWQSAVFFGQNLHRAASPTQATYVSGCLGGGNVVASSSCTVTGVTAGQTILFYAAQFNTGVASVTDSNGTLTHLLGPQAFYSSGLNDIWYEKNAAAGSHALTANYSSGSGNYTTVIGLVFSGSSTTTPIDSSSIADIAAGGTICPSVTTSSANETLVSFVAGGGGGFSLTPGTTPQAMTSAIGGLSEETSAYGTATAAGSNHVTWIGSSVGSQDFACATIALH